MEKKSLYSYSRTCLEHKIMVSQDRWSLVTGSFTSKCRTFCQNLIVLQDRWSFVIVVSHDRFYCIATLISELIISLFLDLRFFQKIPPKAVVP